MASLKYTRNDVLTMCKNLGLTITTEDALGCVAKKDNVIYRFEYITRPVKPKKSVEPVVEEEKPSTTKTKSRGRPRKTKVAEEDATESVVEKKKPSKPRGRPRKTKVTEETTAKPVVEVSEDGVTIAPKKRRGRRSKAEIAAAKAVEADAE